MSDTSIAMGKSLFAQLVTTKREESMDNNPKNFPIVQIKWVDSSAPSEGGWESVDIEKLKHDPLVCYSSGFLVAANDDRVVICASYFEQPETNNIGMMGHISIPTCAILERGVLWEPEEERPPEVTGAPDGVTGIK